MSKKKTNTKKENNPFDTSEVIEKLNASEKEWRSVVANIFIATHSELHDMSSKLGRIEKENLAIMGILGLILAATIKTALGI